MANGGAVTFHGQKAVCLAVFYLSLVCSANAIEQSGENTYKGAYTRQLEVACSGPQTRGNTVVVIVTHRAAQRVLGVGDLNKNTFKRTTPPTGNPSTEIWTATNIHPCAWRNVTTVYFSALTFSLRSSALGQAADRCSQAHYRGTLSGGERRFPGLAILPTVFQHLFLLRR
jgi:hypothetical protein